MFTNRPLFVADELEGSAPGGASATAVADPPAGGDGGEAAAAAAADASAAAAAGEGGQGDEGAPDAAAARARAELGKLALKFGIEGQEFNTAEELDAAIANKRQSDQRTELTNKAKANVATIRKGVEDAVKGIAIQDPTDPEKVLRLTDEQVSAITGHLAGLDDVSGLFEDNVLNGFARIAGAKIPADEHEAFNAAAKGLPFDKWMDKVIEFSVKNTEAWKARELEHTAALEEAREDGFKKGKTAPEGQPSQRGASSSNGGITAADLEGKSPKEIADMKLTSEQIERILAS